MAHGHPFEVLNVWSWEQASLAAECILIHSADKLDAVLTPIITVMGGKVKKRKKPRGRSQRRATKADQSDPARQERAVSRDWNNYMAAQRLGVRFVDVDSKGDVVGRTQMEPPTSRDTLPEEKD